MDEEIPEITYDVGAAANAFNLSLGETLGHWARVESFFMRHFALLTALEHKMARRLFYSARSFQGRVDMLAAAAAASNAKDGHKAFVRAAIKKAREQSGFRNRLAHGETVFIAGSGTRYSGQYVLVEGKTDFDPFEDEAVTKAQLDTAGENFHVLAGALLFATMCDWGDAASDPQGYLRLVRALPNQPHLHEPDPILVAELLQPPPRPG